MREFNFIDNLFISLNSALATLSQAPVASRENPAQTIAQEGLANNKLSAQLMRVDHTGEVCAQALYLGHALTARSKKIKSQMQEAANEENDHLAWCAERLKELDSHTSYLNPLWYTGAFCLGTISGMLGDEWSLGFVAETERQVEQHLEQHLKELPKEDKKSRAILKKMQAEEILHAKHAIQAGARELPWLVQKSMTGMSKIMTTLAKYL